MSAFALDLPQVRVIFGNASIDKIDYEIERLGLHRVMIVSTRGRSTLADAVAGRIPGLVVHHFTTAVPHVPEEVAAEATAASDDACADCVVAIGGGSAIGVAKAIALKTGLPIIAIPTTYSGSEMTPIWGLTSSGIKQTGRDSRVQPRVVLYDPLVTFDLPAHTSALSGLNAIAHCVEALYAVDANPVSSLAAERAIHSFRNALPLIVADPRNAPAREEALTGAWLAGLALGTVQMALHHKLCHTLGGAFDLPHAETHSVLLPYTAAFNRSAAPAAMAIIASALDADDAPLGLLDLARRLGAPGTLAELGMRESDLDRAAHLAVSKAYPNPKLITLSDVRRLLDAAFSGDASYVAS